MRYFTRWASYPVIFGTTAVLQLLLTSFSWPRWPLSITIAGIGMLLVALLERLQPYHSDWNEDHGDVLPDILHALFSLTFIFASLKIAGLLQAIVPTFAIWPSGAAIFIQVLLAGLLIDFGLWFVHWLSHRNPFLWRLHALHHSSERLYWLNGERRHPLSAIVLAGPGTLVTIMLGAPHEVVATWFAIIAVHLAFQHANLDYSVGPLKNIIGVAQVHRWHHKREYEDASVNFGEFWMLWDKLFATFKGERIDQVNVDGVGIRERMPTKYLQQLAWPFVPVKIDVQGL